MNSYDSHGWLALAEIPGRGTDVVPPAHGSSPVAGQPWPNFTGIEWVLVPYSEPVIPTPPAPDYGTKVTRLAFRNRFSGAEKVALYTAAASSVPIKIYLDDLAAATFVDLTRDDTATSLQVLVSAGLLTQARATTILSAPVQPEEVPA